MNKIATFAFMLGLTLFTAVYAKDMAEMFHPGDILSADQLNGLSFQVQTLTARVDKLEAQIAKLTSIALKNNIRVQKVEKKCQK